MCLGIPGEIKSISGHIGTVEIGGVERKAMLSLIDEPKVGDWVLIHAGFAIQRLSEEDARETLRLLEEL
jgi:hydrogenase expression/formation protein HypC